jgi:hypothetical protein
MSYAICPISIAPIRNGANDKSEMISQLLFGDLVEVLERKGRKWVRIRCDWDNFVGWVAGNQLRPVTPTEFDNYKNDYAYSLELYHPLSNAEGYLPIVMGARLPAFDGIHFNLMGQQYTFSGRAYHPASIQPSAAFIIKLVRKYINAPFLWGGRSPMGIDAPGLIQMAYQLAGIKLPREASQQVYIGTPVDFVEQALPGDIAFFENRTGKVTHCGIILDNGQIIHAYGKVRVDNIDHFGIYNKTESRYTHRLRVIKRILQAKQVAKPEIPAADKEVPNQIPLF